MLIISTVFVEIRSNTESNKTNTKENVPSAPLNKAELTPSDYKNPKYNKRRFNQ